MRRPKPFFRSQTQSWYLKLGKQFFPLGPDEKKASQKYHEIMAQRRPELSPDSTGYKLLDKYLGYCKENLAESTFKQRLYHLRKFCTHISKGLRISSLKPHHVQGWIDEHYAGLSDTYKHTAITVVKTAVEWTATMGYIEHSPIAKMKKPTPTVRREYIPAEDWKTIIEAASDQCFRDYLTVALSSGARPQEMRILAAQYFEPEHWRLVFLGKGNRPRAIYLDAVALEVVTRLAKLYSEGPLFRNQCGRPWRKDAIKDRFRRLRQKLKIPGLCATVLRHTYAHHKLTSGVDSHIVSKLMGHKDGRMLAERYGHLEQAAGATDVG